MMPKIVLAKAKVLWGYSIKYPTQSGAQDSSPLPPPTTVLGALAASYARYMKLPETRRVDDKIQSTSARLLSDGIVRYCTSGITRPLAAKHSDVSRNIILIYQKHKQRSFHFAAQAMGKVYAPLPTSNPDDRLLLVYVVDDDHAELVSKLAWGITSIGNREGMVSVDDVLVHELETVDEKVIETPFMTPSDMAKCVRGCMEVEWCSLSIGSYEAERVCEASRFLVPTYPGLKSIFGGDMRVEVSSNAMVSKVMLNGRTTYIAVPRKLLETGSSGGAHN